MILFAIPALKLRKLHSQDSEMNYKFTLLDDVDDNVKDAIVALVVQYNNSKAGSGNGRSLFVVIHDEKNEVIGGLSGYTSRGWLFIDHLVVPEAHRKKGIGTEIMRMAEEEAISRGCTDAWLNTFEFQARGFYERLGYVCFGELPNYPFGFSRFFMNKSLSPR
jgi:GNAT superfamily N-acetyltransferase